ncbi:copper resistance protein B [Thalassospira mesophila]|uniref:Copper resistance protein CopB n=1 Tax=Thalassospira mesophila TaxID=1293891 RepID=A0A1Y2KY28_9PROT|nr:copper resistance protein B [Thalassospira mesophila]OSQ37363.1 copper resistance protein CopB [Thalassospira mesophila]
MKIINLIAIGCGVIAPLLSFSLTAKADNPVFYGLQMEQFEYRAGDEGEKLFSWNGGAFIGTDELKLRWQGEGERDINAGINEKLENRLVLQTPVSDFFDVKGGVRLDTPKGTDRWYGTVGITGLAPQWFEVDADLFVSETGDSSARLDIAYEGLITNHLILTPSVELNAAFSDDPEIEVSKGLSNIELGLRLSYDIIDRSISPYIGIVYERKLGNTASLAKDEGADYEATFAVFGLRLMF